MAEQITLETLAPQEGATSKSKRVGRGRASGHGKTSCRGNNYAEINVSDLEKLGLEEVDLTILKASKKAAANADELRVLGNGEISKAVVVKARYFTASAKEKIEKAGGKAELV